MITIRKGRIAYVSDKDADRGRVRGGERFAITRDADGTTIQRALCQITDPAYVLRDITQTCTATLRPIDCYVRIRTGEKPPFAGGSGWFRFGTAQATCEAETTTEGRVSQKHQLAGGPLAFCNHSIVGDAWMTASYPLAQGPGEFLVRDMLLPTLNKQGATGPMLAHAHLTLKFIGRERLTVRAGTFDCLHFRTSSVPPGGKLSDALFKYDMWCTDDGLYTAVQSGYMGDRRFELVELSDEPL